MPADRYPRPAPAGDAADEAVWDRLDSPLGPLWLAATPEGLCALDFADGPLPPPGWLAHARRHRPRLRLVPREGAGSRLATAVAHLEAARHQLAEYFAGRRRRFELPLDLWGTPFQREVWRALTAIPYGETRSYGQVAAAVGRPGAARAVGRAAGDNPVAVVVPCHRVIGCGGGLVGYGGGLDRKALLLQLERGA